MTELLPCPFCGGEAELTDMYDCEECSVIDMCDWHDDHGTCKGCEKYGCWCCVVCDFNKGGCGATGGWRDNPDAAIAAWNTRAVRTCKLIRHGSLANMPSFICWSCSECGFGWHHSENDKQFSFCPNCGAKVVGE